MDYKTLLNERQFEAVSTDSQYTRIVAGAGSGKTRVLTYRISFLIGERSVDPASILAIAFTNKVAGEMRIRALSLLKGMGGGLQVLTFHSFCARFLRKEIDVIGFPNNFTIMDDDDQSTLIKNIGVDMGFKKNDDIVKQAARFIAYYKSVGTYPTEVTLDKNASDLEKKLLVFFHKYEERKDEMLSLDFDDLLLRAIQILEEFPEIRTKWQNRFSNILIDEFQDTNDVQYKLVKLLLKDTTSLYVVGDPDQTIYTWRGANQGIILNFNKDFPFSETIILDRNYRSTKTILNTANKLISHNKKRVPKDLYTENDEGAAVTVKQTYSREEEARYVVDQIENLHIQYNVNYRDIALLYRASYLTAPFESEFMRRRIPYQIFGSVKFFQRKEIKDVLAYFRLMINCHDDLSFERIINVPRRGIGSGTLDILKAEKEAAGVSYYEYILNIEKYMTNVKSKALVALTFMVNKIEAAKQRLSEGLEAYPKILEDFIVDIGYYDYLASDDEDGEERVGNVKSLFDQIVDFIKQFPESTFENYLENAALQTSQDEIRNGDYVSLMTIHIAKGLEFDNVFVISLVEGIFPSNRTMDESGHDGLEEERRLCYVAFTRAKKRLFITFNLGYSFILESKQLQSRFIEEAGLSIRKEGYGGRPVPKKPSYSQYFPDDNRPDYFGDEPPKPARPKDNGIRDWKIGDIAVHEKFGRGVVTNVIDDAIIEVDFESCGKKSILSNHPMIKREQRGGLA